MGNDTAATTDRTASARSHARPAVDVRAAARPARRAPRGVRARERRRVSPVRLATALARDRARLPRRFRRPAAGVDDRPAAAGAAHAPPKHRALPHCAGECGGGDLLAAPVHPPGGVGRVRMGDGRAAVHARLQRRGAAGRGICARARAGRHRHRDSMAAAATADAGFAGRAGVRPRPLGLASLGLFPVPLASVDDALDARLLARRSGGCAAGGYPRDTPFREPLHALPTGNRGRDPECRRGHRRAGGAGPF